MKLAIIGSRNFNDYGYVVSVWAVYFVGKNVTEIISGGAKGADLLGKKLALEKNIPYIEFKPDWEKFGKSAGFIRNTDIIKNCDIVLAFWDGISKGTAHSLGLAKKYKKNSFIFYFN